MSRFKFKFSMQMEESATDAAQTQDFLLFHIKK